VRSELGWPGLGAWPGAWPGGVTKTVSPRSGCGGGAACVRVLGARLGRPGPQ
jgi:hypothetical protein